MKYYIKRKNMPKNSRQRFYNFGLLTIFPRILKIWDESRDQIKYFFDKPGMRRWYIHKIKEAAFQGDWITVIICCIILLYRKEKLNEI